MARSYIVRTTVTDPADTLIKIGWSYGDPIEPVQSNGTHVLSEDAQVQVAGLSQQDLVGILVADLPNSTEEFDASLDAAIAEINYQESLVAAPAPGAPVYITANVVDGSAPSTDFKWLDVLDPTFVSLVVGAVIISSDGVPAGATCLTKDDATGVTTWSESTTLSGTDVAFTIVYENP